MSEVRSRANAREARLVLGHDFKQAIHDFQACTRHLKLLSVLLTEAPVPFNETALRILAFIYPRSLARGALATWMQDHDPSNPSESASIGTMKLFVRVRPLLSSEEKQGEYSCTTVDLKGIVVHDGRIAKDGRSMYMVHRRFLTSTFNDNANTEAVYHAAMRPLVQKAAEEGVIATTLMWGQTGTGKTFTATGLLRSFAQDLHSRYWKDRDSEDTSSIIQVRAFEMAGTKRGMLNQLEMFDLLANRRKVFLRVDEHERPHVRGCVQISCSNLDEFQSVLCTAFEHRTTSSVERNEQSSRSHMFFEVQLPGEKGGLLRIGDLAGSERNYEVQYHSRARHAEGGDINASLMVLKDCIRLRRQQLVDPYAPKTLRVPYRDSKLTLYLKDCFTDTPCALIATISPTPTDVDHTTNTLVHVATMRSVPGIADQGLVARQSVFKAKSTTVQSRSSKDNVQDWNVLNRWDHVQADDDIYQLEGADAEALVWILRHRSSDKHDVRRWTPTQVQSWLKSLELQNVPIPSTMTGAQLCRLGLRRLESLAGPELGQQVFAALQFESQQSKVHLAEQRRSTRQIFDFALGPRASSQATTVEAEKEIINGSDSETDDTEDWKLGC